MDIEILPIMRKDDSDVFANRGVQKSEIVMPHPNGDNTYYEMLKIPYIDSHDKTLGIIAISRNITHRIMEEKKILKLTYQDVLTKIHNRTYFEKEIKSLDDADQLPLSIILGDINGLKIINDALGHAEGDLLLVNTAKLLRSCIRPADVLARIGGDEFCILMPKTDNKTAQTILNQIISTSSRKKYVSISLGLATKNDPEESFAKIFSNAEEYMYRSKMLNSKSQHNSLIASMKTTMFEKSNETEEHADRISKMSRIIGYDIDLSEKEIVELELLSNLHDIGKIAIDKRILKKPGKLTEEEWAELKKHPEIGYRITNAIPELKHISKYILSHHERWDGTGYPQGLSGESIPILSRILAVVDSYDAMTHDRIYRKALTKEEAVSELMCGAGTQYDPEIVKVLLSSILKNDLHIIN
jgi:diguanylate cyclase (GGDEF)-like protein